MRKATLSVIYANLLFAFNIKIYIYVLNCNLHLTFLITYDTLFSQHCSPVGESNGKCALTEKNVLLP